MRCSTSNVFLIIHTSLLRPYVLPSRAHRLALRLVNFAVLLAYRTIFPRDIKALLAREIDYFNFSLISSTPLSRWMSSIFSAASVESLNVLT